MMTTSVIVATKNRAADLERMLPTLLSQTHLPQEVIIVDGSRGEDTRRLIENFARDLKPLGQHEPEMTYLYRPALAGLGSARNAGIEQAGGEILVFLDDDVLLEPEFLHELLVAYQQNPEAGAVSGVVTNYALPSRSARILGRLFWTGPFHDERQPLYWRADRLRDQQPIPVTRLTGALMSIRRDALAGDRFDSFHAEDAELTWRIHERCPVLIAPGARLSHARSKAGRERDDWIRQDALENYYLYHRLWRRRLVSRVCFAWLNLGYALLASVASVRRLSLRPWQSFLQGRRSGRERAYPGGKK
jgi:GT2 family glycosyltransferase